MVGNSEINKLAKKSLMKILPEILKHIKNTNLSGAPKLKQETLINFRKIMQSYAISTRPTDKGFVLQVDVGLDSYIKKYDRSVKGGKINLFDLYDKSKGQPYQMSKSNGYMRFEWKNFSPTGVKNIKEGSIIPFKSGLGFVKYESGKWYTYVKKVNRISFRGFGLEDKNDKFADMFADQFEPDLNDLLEGKAVAMIKKIKGIKSK